MRAGVWTERRALRRAAVCRCLHGCLVSVSGRSSWSSRLACGCVSGRRFLPTGSPLPEEPDLGSMWSHEPSNLAFGCGLVRALTLRASRWTVTLRSYTQMQCPCYTHLGVYSSDRTKRRPRRPRWRRRLCDCASLTWICECDVEQLYTDAALMLDASTRVVAAAGSGRASSTWHLHVSLASSTMQMAQQPCSYADLAHHRGYSYRNAKPRSVASDIFLQTLIQHVRLRALH